jgi:hypothetical protein
MSGLLTKAQLAELQQVRDEAQAKFQKINPKLGAMLAGISLSGGGREKILDYLVQAFERLQEKIQLESEALMYLLYDQFRPRGKWTLSTEQRELNAEFNNEMDRRAWMAVTAIKATKGFLGN